MQETAFVDSQGGLLSSRGGAQTHWHRHIGTSLTGAMNEAEVLDAVESTFVVVFLMLSIFFSKEIHKVINVKL